jgi:hypothetical protein
MKKIMIICMVGLLGCAGNGSKESYEKTLKKFLSTGDGESALTYIKENKDKLTECEFLYASMLANFLVFLKEINTLSQPVLSPSAVDYLANAYYQFIKPIEKYLVNIDEMADEIISKKCSFVLEDGLKIEIGKKGGDYYLMAVLGDEWDEGEAYLLSIFSNILLSAIDLIFSHSGEVQTLLVPNVYSEEPLATLRELGGFFDVNPRLLEFSKDPELKKRFSILPERLKKIAEYIYSNGGTKTTSSDDTGFLAYLLNREDEYQDDDVLGFVDRGEKGKIDVGDEFVFGIKSFDADIINFPEVSSGIRLKITTQIYPVVKKLIETVEEYSQTLWEQMNAVENPEKSYKRIGFKPLNELLKELNQNPVPEVLELDLAAFFREPVPLRRLLPYWYDDDNDIRTPKKFVVEGECPVDKGFDFIYIYDLPHFPDSFTFTYNLTEQRIVSGVRIKEDGIFPSINYTIPYIAFQDPTFNNSVYVNPSATGEGANEWKLPDNYLLNRAIAVLLKFANEGLTPNF